MQSDRLNPAQTQVKAAYIDVQNKLHKIIRLLVRVTAESTVASGTPVLHLQSTVLKC